MVGRPNRVRSQHAAPVLWSRAVGSMGVPLLLQLADDVVWEEVLVVHDLSREGAAQRDAPFHRSQDHARVADHTFFACQYAFGASFIPNYLQVVQDDQGLSRNPSTLLLSLDRTSTLL